MKLFRLYVEETSGQFAMMLAIMMTFLIGGIALAVETSNLIRIHSQIVRVAETAAIIGAKDWEEKDRIEKVKAHIAANNDLFASIMDGEPEIIFNDEGREVNVIIRTDSPLTIGRFLGRKSVKVSGQSLVGYQEFSLDPVSIAFALDVSGSMGGNTSDGQRKISTLKRSVSSLFTSLERASNDPNKLRKSLRTGMSAFNTVVVNEEPMDWGWSSLEKATDKLIASGNRNTVPALTNSHEQIKEDRIFRRNNDPKYNRSFHRELAIFMTDGSNDPGNGDVNKARQWDEDSIAKCEEMRGEGIEIFSVSFDAGDGLLVLLECASWNSPEEEADFNDNHGDKDPEKCLKNGNGNGVAGGHCGALEAMKDAKSDYFFDAQDAAAFEAAFMEIGDVVGATDIRVKS